MLVVVARVDSGLSANDVLTWLGERVARWWLPERVLFLEQIPHTATGKISKTQLREQVSGMEFSDEQS